MNPRLILLAGALLGASLTHGLEISASPTVLGLLLAAWALSAAAPKTPVGRFPTAAIFYLLLIGLSSPALAAVAAVVGFLFAALANWGGDLGAELRLGTLPVLLTTSVANLVLVGQPLPMMVATTGFVYLLALNICAGWQAEQGHRMAIPWQELRWAFLRSSMVLPLLAAMGAALLPLHPAWLLVLAVVGWFQASGAVTELVRSQIRPMSHQLKTSREREQRWVTRLKTLEILSKRLTGAPDVEAAGRAVALTAQEYCQSPEVRVQLSLDGQNGSNLTRQPGASYFPMAEAGMIEVRCELSPEQSGLLTTLATTAGFALRMVHGRQSQLRAVTHERDQMETWLARLRVLLEASQSMASSLSIDALLDAIPPVLHKMIAHQGHAVLCFEPARRRSNLDGNEAQSALEALTKAGKDRFEPDLLGVGVVFEGQARGALILKARSEGPPFSQIDLELLRVFAYQLSGAFERTRLYEQMVAAESQVVQASKMAAVGQLAAGVAHELNTPLGTVLMAIEYAEQSFEDRPEQARKRLNLAARAGTKAQGIIAKLLHFSREATLEDQPVDLGAVVHDAAELLRYHLDLTEVRLKIERQPCALVRGNENELHQVVSNLILNSRDAIATGDYPKEILVRLWQDGGQAKLAVIDRGPGIAPEIRNRIFEPFFTTRPVGEGTGLGLSVSSQIVAKHGGQLQLESDSEATTFTMTLATVSAIL